jgi:hypothetical protein
MSDRGSFFSLYSERRGGVKKNAALGSGRMDSGCVKHTIFFCLLWAIYLLAS